MSCSSGWLAQYSSGNNREYKLAPAGGNVSKRCGLNADNVCSYLTKQDLPNIKSNS